MIIGKTRTNQPVENSAELPDAIAEIVEDMVEGGELENAKPIYYHGIVIGGNLMEIQLVILDNNSTAYTKETFKTKLLELLDSGAIINCNGAVDISGSIYPAYLITKSGGGTYLIAYHTTTSLQGSVSFTDYYDNIATDYFHDGVNKIN